MNMLTDAAPDAGAAATEGGAATAAVDQAADNSAAATAAEGGNADASGAATAEDGQKKDEQKTGAPESYDLKAPEGRDDFDAEVLGQFSDVARGLNLDNESAQKMIDQLGKIGADRQAKVVEAAAQKWQADAKADKEFGGEKITESLAMAKGALEQFGTPELKELLNQSRLANHPEIIRLLYRVKKAVSDDSFVGAGSGPAARNDARSLYSASNMNP